MGTSIAADSGIFLGINGMRWTSHGHDWIWWDIFSLQKGWKSIDPYKLD